MDEDNSLIIQKIKDAPLYQTIVVNVDWLIPADYNPRTIEENEMEALKKSLAANKDFFRARPVLVNTAVGREGVIIGGHKRWEAAKELGWSTVPAMLVLAETIAKEKAWNLIDNNNNGQWDMKKKQEVIMDLHESDFDLTTLGHTPENIASMLGDDFDLGVEPKDDPENKGTTPSKKRRCPECGYVGLKKDFEVVKD